MRKATFWIDEDGEFEGYHDPENKWNGHAVPYFTKETAEKVLETIAKEYRLNPDVKPSEQFYWGFNSHDNYFLYANAYGEGSEYVYPIQYEGQDLYCIGGYEWAWGWSNESI